MTSRYPWLAALVAAGCGASVPVEQAQLDELAAAGTEVAAGASFGDAIPGLTAAERARFESGRDAFQEEETAADGLGPVFNEASCVACHLNPGAAVGGSNGRLETRFGTTTNGKFDPMAALGGSLLQDHGIGQVGTFNFLAEVVPASATIVTRRRTTPLFGLGLVDSIPDDELKLLARVQAIARPRIAGRPHIVTDLSTGKPAVGKLGWKAQNPNLFQFSGDAYLNEMGITSPQFPNESCPQGDCTLLAGNPRPDLNNDGTDVQKFTDFMRMLAPPPRGPITAKVRAGEVVAAIIGCLDCHVPTLVTGRTDVHALSFKLLHPFSDFLLHDMGSLGDGIEQGAATGRQLRTAPLWGLRAQAPLLHDGRAHTIADAILAHDGQGRGARDKFAALPASSREALLAFLSSL